MERKQQHILNVARSLHFHSHVPLSMWNYYVQHVTHIINRLPSPVLKSHNPYELLFKTPPSYMHLKVFGCLCYATSSQSHMTKFDSRARKSMFLGYKEGVKGFILYDLSSHDIFFLEMLFFYESFFPFHKVDKTPSPPTSHVHTLDDIHIPGPIPDNYVPTDPTSPQILIFPLHLTLQLHHLAILIPFMTCLHYPLSFPKTRLLLLPHTLLYPLDT